MRPAGTSSSIASNDSAWLPVGSVTSSESWEQLSSPATSAFDLLSATGDDSAPPQATTQPSLASVCESEAYLQDGESFVETDYGWGDSDAARYPAQAAAPLLHALDAGSSHSVALAAWHRPVEPQPATGGDGGGSGGDGMDVGGSGLLAAMQPHSPYPPYPSTVIVSPYGELGTPLASTVAVPTTGAFGGNDGVPTGSELLDHTMCLLP